MALLVSIFLNKCAINVKEWTKVSNEVFNNPLHLSNSSAPKLFSISILVAKLAESDGAIAQTSLQVSLTIYNFNQTLPQSYPSYINPISSIPLPPPPTPTSSILATPHPASACLFPSSSRIHSLHRTYHLSSPTPPLRLAQIIS